LQSIMAFASTLIGCWLSYVRQKLGL